MVRKAGKLHVPDRPEYEPDPGSPSVPEVMWEDVERRLRSERDYGLVTTRPDGRPHAVPEWAVWVEEALWFTSSPRTATARNLVRDARALVHLDSGRWPSCWKAGRSGRSRSTSRRRWSRRTRPSTDGA